MKADEPRAPVAKYGMPIEYADRIVQRHFEVLEGERAIDAACMAHNMRVGPALAAALDGRPSFRAPIPDTPASTMPEAVSVGAQGLRARLGLS